MNSFSIIAFLAAVGAVSATQLQLETLAQLKQSPILMEPGTVGQVTTIGTCPNGELECLQIFRTVNESHDICYNPTTHDCIDNFVCPLTHPNRCLDACYASEFYVCHNKETLCPTSAPALGIVDGQSICYDDSQFIVENGRLVSLRSGGEILPLQLPIKGDLQMSSVQIARVEEVQAPAPAPVPAPAQAQAQAQAQFVAE